MDEHRPSWSAGLVVVCGNERPPGASKPSCGRGGGVELRRWLKDRLKADGLWGAARAVRSGCLGCCPPGRVTVLLPSGTCLLVDPSSAQERERLYRRILEALPQGGAPPGAHR